MKLMVMYRNKIVKWVVYIGSLDDIGHSSHHTISWSSQNSVRIKSQVAFSLWWWRRRDGHKWLWWSTAERLNNLHQTHPTSQSRWVPSWIQICSTYREQLLSRHGITGWFNSCKTSLNVLLNNFATLHSYVHQRIISWCGWLKSQVHQHKGTGLKFDVIFR